MPTLEKRIVSWIPNTANSRERPHAINANVIRPRHLHEIMGLAKSHKHSWDAVRSIPGSTPN